jgi:hypothetical protein
MTPQNFCYWLNGFFEISGSVKSLSTEQINMIKAHLRLVFRDSIDPSMGDKEHQNILNAMHQGIATNNDNNDWINKLQPGERC